MASFTKVSAFVVMATLATLSVVEAKQTVQVSRTVWEQSDFPDLGSNTEKVCTGSAIKSDKLMTACKDKKFPSVTKAGLYRNVGIGAELNTLIRQLQGSSASTDGKVTEPEKQ